MVEFAHDSRNVSEATRGGVHGGSSTQLHGAAFAVSGDKEVCAQALQCWLGFDQESGWDGAGARGCPYLNLGGLQLEVSGAGGVRCQVVGGWDVLRLDPDVPVVQVYSQLGPAVKCTLGFGEDMSRYGGDRCCKTAW